MIVAFEGGDAVGKNTMTKRLAQELGREKKTLLLSFPRYETRVGQAIRRHLIGETSLRNHHIIDSSDTEIDGLSRWDLSHDDPLVFQCMMVADKYHAAPLIKYSKIQGTTVILDRWWQAASVYGASEGLDEKWLFDVQAELPRADLNILLDLPVEVALERRPEMRDRYEKDIPKRRDIRERYLNLWHEYQGHTKNAVLSSTIKSHGQWEIIDANKTPELVYQNVLAVVRGFLVSHQ
jgi:thymidylate kinase